MLPFGAHRRGDAKTHETGNCIFKWVICDYLYNICICFA